MSEYRVIYSRAEEKVNYSTHGFATILSLIGLVVLLSKAIPTNDLYKIIGAALFGGCMTLTFLSSTIYHYIKDPKRKHTLRIFDHIAIYLFIAGSYTPFALLTLPTNIGLFIGVTVWTLTLFGISFKFLIRNKLDNYTKIDAILYSMMGCLAVLFVKPILTHLPMNCIIILALGGACYLIGVVFYLQKSIPYNHGIWHLLAMLGALLHYCAVFIFVL